MHPREIRRRRQHAAMFKAAAVAACREPGASVAAVALARQLNANLLRRWVKEAPAAPTMASVVATRDPPISAATFVPLKLESRRESALMPAERPIRVHIRKGRSRITIEWPVTAAGACGSWLRELLG